MLLPFPKIYKVLVNDELRKNMHYAIVHNGKIVATNGNVMVYSDIAVFVENPELTEGKIFDKALLKWMSRKEVVKLVCTKTDIIAHLPKNKTEEKPYSGYINDEDGHFPMYLTGNDKTEIGVYPRYYSCIPDDRLFKSSTGITKISYTNEQFAIITQCFSFWGNDKICFEFSDEEGVVRVTPTYTNENDSPYGKQAALIMPLKKDKKRKK